MFMKLLSRLNRLKYIYFRARSLSIAVPAAKRDLFKAIVFVSLIYWLSWHFDAAEQLSGFTSRYETMQLDELPIAMLMAALAGIWFSRRRMEEIKAEANLRAEAESSLASLLSENRALAAHARQIQEQERKRMAQDIHDDMGQYLTAIRLDARSLTKLDDPVVVSRAERIGMHTEHVQKAIRNLLHHLQPVALDEYGLIDAVRHMVQEWKGQHPATRFNCMLDYKCGNLPDNIKLTAYRVVQEALTNISRHAEATVVSVTIEVSGERNKALEIKVKDNGKGCDMSANSRQGFGLTAMRERVAVVGGSFMWQSAVNSGTCISIRLPLINTLELKAS
jgi:two-component system sensor histidine kinase UhpB